MQSRKMSALESITNLILGYIIAIILIYHILPIYGFEATANQSFSIVTILTVVSFIRGYLIRRTFNIIVKTFQTRIISMTESMSNLIIGYLISVFLIYHLFPLYGFNINSQQSMSIVAIFVMVSFIRTYLIRRFFNLLEIKQNIKENTYV